MAIRKKPQGATGPSVLERIDEFERRRRRAGPDDPPDLIVPQAERTDDVATVLPEGWTDAYLPRTSSVRKWAFRWTVLALIVACGVAIALGIDWYLEVAENEAVAVRDGYRAALEQVADTIDGGQDAMLDITAPETTPEQLVLELAPFTTFQGAVGTLSSRVRADLPTTPPLAPRDALEELEPLRGDLALVAGRGDAVVNRLGKLINYRLVFAEMFQLPELPVRATASEIDTLSPALAQAIADSVQSLAQLPADDFLDGHRAAAQETIDFLRNWQPGYVSALQSDDRSQAERLTLRLAGRLIQVRNGIDEPLEEMRTWATTELDGLRRDVDNALVLVGP